ncbi:hypothetical protein [Dysgonomonas termitidis]|uniref:DUF1018 domain-containing protein n=1 Tax=Dysgonomonas termitidis TaxID=1516126 RepID=A0ABV9KUE4_9BACT
MSDFAKFYALLKQLPYADKEEIVLSYSGKRTASLREFKRVDATGFRYMLADLERKAAPPQPSPEVREQADAETEVKKRKYRSLILRAMQEQGVTVKNRDWSEVNNFVVRYAGEGKTLKNMSLEELKKFSRQVHKLLEWHNNKRQEMLIKAIMN